MALLALLACAHHEPAPAVSVEPAAPTVWVAAPAPASMGPAGALTMLFTGAQLPGYIEVNCDSGFRERASVAGGYAAFPAVPVRGACRAFPKGVVATAVVVNGGQVWDCAVVGTTTACVAVPP
ncbi:hypothetical protein LBMAG42_24250 [Deltaproteobacteria bacterium]|nr:hypothetical protein LBMAG42_24250 [Deltaproteobacteria bacterium]